MLSGHFFFFTFLTFYTVFELSVLFTILLIILYCGVTTHRAKDVHCPSLSPGMGTPQSEIAVLCRE